MAKTVSADDDIREWSSAIDALAQRIEADPHWAELRAAALDLAGRAREVIRRLARLQRLAHAEREVQAMSEGPERAEIAMHLRVAQARAGALPAHLRADRMRHDPEGHMRDLPPWRRMEALRDARDAVLRVGLWRVLDRQLEHAAAAGIAGWMARLSAPTPMPQAVIAPRRTPVRRGAVPYARTEAAADFHNHRLRGLLRNLARLYDATGARFAHWAELPDYDPGRADAADWAGAWTIAACATYIDWMRSIGDGTILGALRQVLAGHRPHFKPPQALVRPDPAQPASGGRPAALPTDDDAMHVELRCRLLLTQLLDYTADRWGGADAGLRQWVLNLPMTRLGQFDSRRRDDANKVSRHITFYRGLQVGQLYECVLVTHTIDTAAGGRR